MFIITCACMHVHDLDACNFIDIVLIVEQLLLGFLVRTLFFFYGKSTIKYELTCLSNLYQHFNVLLTY